MNGNGNEWKDFKYFIKSTVHTVCMCSVHIGQCELYSTRWATHIHVIILYVCRNVSNEIHESFTTSNSIKFWWWTPFHVVLYNFAKFNWYLLHMFYLLSRVYPDPRLKINSKLNYSIRIHLIKIRSNSLDMSGIWIMNIKSDTVYYDVLLLVYHPNSPFMLLFE